MAARHSQIWNLFERIDRPAKCKRCGSDRELGWVALKTTGKWMLCETTRRHPLASYEPHYMGVDGLWANKGDRHVCYAREVGAFLDGWVRLVRNCQTVISSVNRWNDEHPDGPKLDLEKVLEGVAS